jgi:outer membrane protein assembly factor BamB
LTADNPKVERQMRAAVLAAALAVLAAALAGPAVMADDWQKRHRDPLNTGFAYPDPTGSQSPGLAGLELVWTYPWPLQQTKWMEQVVDEKDEGKTPPLFQKGPAWEWSETLTGPASNAYNNTYYLAPVWTPDSVFVPRTTARWTPDLDGLPSPQRYLVYVWFPSSTATITNSSHVTYTIREADGTISRVTIDQGSGGQWVQLGTRSYLLDGSSYIEVSNVSEARQQVSVPIPGEPDSGFVYVDKGRFVAADAIRIVLDEGSIYSSPAVFSASGLPYGARKGVVFGIVDRDPAGRSADSGTGGEVTFGRVVCVDAEAGPGRQGNPSNPVLNRPLWEYPRPRAERRSPLEGPIAGGVYSSPLVVNTPDGLTVFVGADDGQIYALNARTGDLRWMGPGKTLDDSSPGVTSSGFSPVAASDDDFFGQGYLAAPATPNADTHSITYEFRDLDKYYYNVYAWMPAVRPDEERLTAARYRVESDSGEATVQVNQDVCERGDAPACDCLPSTNGGRWVRVGGTAYLPKNGVIRVTLTSRAIGSACNPSKTRQVVADAVRLIPEHLGPFGYASPTAASLGGTVSRIFSANSAGRIIALDAAGAPDASTRMRWIYPATRRSSSEMDAEPLGGMAGTVAIDGSRLFYGSVTGKVGMLEAIGSGAPTVGWQGLKAQDGSDITDIGAVTASPMVDGNFVYFATSRGRLYKVEKASGKVADGWPYPTAPGWTPPPGNPAATAGAFRYSSPAKAIVGGTPYVVIGSADGFLHRVPMSGPAQQVKLQAPGSIYSSPATVTRDGTVPEAAYFGTQTGVFVGMSLDTASPQVWGWNTLSDAVFSSPAVSDHWVYVGGDDGRMYAFISRANGGAGWPVGDPSIPSEPPGSEYDESQSGGSAYFDLEVVSQEDYNDPEGYFDRSGVYSEGRTNRHPRGTPPQAFEWGETIYVLAWTFENPNARISFRMQNVGQGSEAGALLTATQTASAQYSKQVEVDGRTGTVYYARFAWVLDATKLMTPGASYTITGQLQTQAQQGQRGRTLTAAVPKDNDISSIDPARRTTPPRLFTINNPLAISIPSIGFVGPGWKGVAGRPFQPGRDDYGTRFNGMYDESSGVVPANAIPVLRSDPARHGSNSRPELVYLADRSMLGYTRPNNPQSLINSLRVGRNEMRFPGPPIFQLPWETSAVPGFINSSKYYPDLPASSLVVTKKLDGADPTRGAASLLPCSGPDTGPPDSRWVTPDPLELVTEVPKYQPPGSAPYSTRVRAWVDANASGTVAGQLDLADERVTGRPLDGSEVYREWFYAVEVLPDFNMYAEERTVDIGKRPVGFGISAPADEFIPFPGFPSASLFRPFTIRNDGNVNLVDLRILNTVQAPWVPPQLRHLFSEQVQALDFNNNGALDPGEGFALSAFNIVSSLDPRYHGAAPNSLPLSQNGYNYVLSKPLVGALGPTTLTLPDQYQYEALVNSSPPGTNIPRPVLPLISVRVPIGTPSGTYSQVVPVVARRPDGMNIANPVTSPSMTVTVTVREGRLTGGVTEGSLPNIDVPDPAQPRWGNAQPAAYRVWSGAPGSVNTGPLALVWTSNRETGTTPGQPWRIFRSVLQFDPNTGGFVPQIPAGGPARWWTPVDAGTAWPQLSQLASLFPGEPDGLPGNLVANTAKFTSPSVGQDILSGATWFVFTGQVDKTTGPGAPVRTEHRLFYARADSQGLLDPGSIRTIPTQDYTTPKLSPRILVRGQRLFVFWHSSLGGQYRLFYTVNSSAGAPNAWSPDAQLVVPASVMAAAEPVGIFRPGLRRPDPDPDPMNPGEPKRMECVDVVYSGIVRNRGNASLLLSRYWVSGSSLSIQPLARVFNEELVRDTGSIGLYRSAHLAWRRPSGPNTAEYPVIAVWRWDPAANTFAGPDRISDAPPQVDDETGLVVYDTARVSQAFAERYGRVVLDASAGTVKFERPLPVKDRVVAEYTPQTWVLSSGSQTASAPFAFLEKTLRPLHDVDRSVFPATYGGPLSYDRLWLFWRSGQGALPGNAIYYRTMRPGLQLKRPVALEADGTPTSLVINDGGGGAYTGPWEFDWANNRILFTEEAENANIWVQYRSSDGNTYIEPEGRSTPPYAPLGWLVERGDTAMPVDSMVNEGQVFAFADPDGLRSPSDPLYKPSLIWVFWTSTRAGATDLYYQTLSPPLRAVTRQ